MAKLTVKQLQALKPADIGKVLRDGDGLWGKVRKAGDGVSASFWYQYRVGTKRREIACGTWPATPLTEIREARNKARDLVRQGLDPIEQREADKREREAAEATRKAEQAKQDARLTVRALFAQWAVSDLGGRKDGGKETIRGLEKDVLPAIGERYADDIRRADLMKILDAVKARGAPRLANRLLAELRQMLGYALVREIVAVDPTSGIEKKHVGGPNEERERTLSDKELRALPAALKAADLLDSTQHAVMALLATNARVGELIKARKADIDLSAATWRIPASNAKNDDTHVIHLSPFALMNMRALMELSSNKVWLMPSSKGDNHIDVKSITKQISDRQLRFYDRAAHSKRTTQHANALVLGDEKWTPHDLRRTAATLMQAVGVQPAVIEACLNHREQNRMARVYQRHDYGPEKREAWARLGERLSALTTDNVIVLPMSASAS
ncbi:tyrosine-type recombinase/integrase [Paraburkholderia elongata]|uniref:Tyrosine-type recombinase/integrase n=1 Tax=Paraburkholderia elongata TaxID=2675747 RepID=A0A972SIR5_9BURK|nr:tyrosine-type recombinase/integrase [Paraburkholderia elongata]NPT54910.1 tyrosine-type recombinase/integrase [Paraburkholderia elongata]NPT60939.1 tyrosine-type recombinase/integrase [Paraburkholderia elongata]